LGKVPRVRTGDIGFVTRTFSRSIVTVLTGGANPRSESDEFGDGVAGVATKFRPRGERPQNCLQWFNTEHRAVVPPLQVRRLLHGVIGMQLDLFFETVLHRPPLAGGLFPYRLQQGVCDLRPRRFVGDEIRRQDGHGRGADDLLVRVAESA